jgi:hypothetical protein
MTSLESVKGSDNPWVVEKDTKPQSGVDAHASTHKPREAALKVAVEDAAHSPSKRKSVCWGSDEVDQEPRMLGGGSGGSGGGDGGIQQHMTPPPLAAVWMRLLLSEEPLEKPDQLG